MPPRRWLILLSLCLLPLAAVGGGHGHEHDHDQARTLVDRGEILPLAQLIARLQLPAGARIIEADLERSHGRYLYEIELLRPDGVVEELKVDARDGRILKREED